MAGRPKTRARRAANERARKNGWNAQPPTYPELAAVYAQEYDNFFALRQAMVEHGIVEHGLNPYQVIQRAIDDTCTDYLLLRKRISKDTGGNIKRFVNHPLYDHMEHTREAMVRYSTFAMQYDIARRQLQLSETRIALLAVTLRTALEKLGLNKDQIKQIPSMLIETVIEQQAKVDHNPSVTQGRQRLDPKKAEALAEILDGDNDVVIEYKEQDPSA